MQKHLHSFSNKNVASLSLTVPPIVIGFLGILQLSSKYVIMYSTSNIIPILLLLNILKIKHIKSRSSFKV